MHNDSPMIPYPVSWCMVGLVIRIHVSPSLISSFIGGGNWLPLSQRISQWKLVPNCRWFPRWTWHFLVAWVAGGSAPDFWSIFCWFIPHFGWHSIMFFWVGTPSGKTPVGYHNSCTVRAVFPAPAPAAAAAQEAHGCSGVRMSGVFCSMSPSPTPH